MKRMYLTLAATLLAAGALAPLSAQSFGNAITIGDGQLFVGEPTYDMRSGVVYVFSQDASGAWSQTQRLEPASGEAENRFGIRLATQDDVLLVSATRPTTGPARSTSIATGPALGPHPAGSRSMTVARPTASAAASRSTAPGS